MVFQSLQARLRQIAQLVVTAEQMHQIEAQVFAAGMPVAALMEKVAGLMTQRLLTLLPQVQRWGVLVGPGHNGGDALVIARELHLRGHEVKVLSPFSRLKELTEQHARYGRSLGIEFAARLEQLQDADVLLDGLFGVGLTRSLSGDTADLITQVNQSGKPVVSIDLPSGLHTDTGEVLGTAIKATHTLCLGLWKQGLLQEQALEFVGEVELVDFDLPLATVLSVLDLSPSVRRVTADWAIAQLPLPRPATTHKYQMGHLLLICGSRRYAGGAILTALGARASGVGMLSIAAPAFLKSILTAQLPDALVLECPETPNGAISNLPTDLDLTTFQAIACGPGLTLEASTVVDQVLQSDRPLVLDADGLNLLAQQGVATLQTRPSPTILTPHLGEFKRLFPAISASLSCRVTAVQKAAHASGAIVLLKGARVAIADPTGATWINPTSTAALARGGSGDVLTGLLGGLLAQLTASSGSEAALHSAAIAAWWHAQAGILAMQERSELGVDASTLSTYLNLALAKA